MSGARSSAPAWGRLAAGIAVVGGGGLAALPAVAQDRLSVDVAASAGVSTNPYLTAGSTPTVADATLDLHPSWVVNRPLTKLQVDADVQATVYSSRYSTNESVNVLGAGSHQVSEFTTITGQISYLNSIVGSFTDARVPVGAVVTDNQLPLYLADPSLGGIGGRRQVAQADGGVQVAISARDQVSAGVSASLSRFGGNPQSDYNLVSPRVAYSRAIAERFSAGVSFQASVINYSRSAFGDSVIYSPSLTLSRGLSNGWVVEASAGASVVEFRHVANARSSTSFSGSLGVCKRNTRTSACFTASRQAAPSAAQDLRFQTSVGASLGYRFSERDELSATATYSHSGGSLQQSPTSGFLGSSVDYVALTGTYTRRIARRLSGFASAGYAQAYDDQVNRDPNFTARAGISIRLGSRQ